ncbi:MAG TPA: hypothetical protein PK544_05520 [Spirochaetota bacterium]|nr:hypothetical protein [Spirochaetota bacterium]HPQ54897.1 hypothetical protein [Spirochaetota bacterium]
MRTKLIGAALAVLIVTGVFVYFRYFFTYEQRNIIRRQLDSITGQNLTVTVFGWDGRIIKRWTNVQKISSGKDLKYYTFFYTKDGKYVQIPASVWYVAEEE